MPSMHFKNQIYKIYFTTMVHFLDKKSLVKSRQSKHIFLKNRSKSAIDLKINRKVQSF